MAESFIRKPRVLAKTGFSNSTLYRLINEGKFPAPIKLCAGGRASAWIESEIDAWVESRIRASRDNHEHHAGQAA